MDKEPTTPTNMTLQDSMELGDHSMPSPSVDSSKAHQEVHVAPQQHPDSSTHLIESNENEIQSLVATSGECNDKETAALQGIPSSSATINPGELLQEDSGRERLKRHRIEVAGSVWIPDIWGQEELLKDWIDCTAFDAALVHNSIMSARAALVQEGRRANSGRLRVENRC